VQEYRPTRSESLGPKTGGPRQSWRLLSKLLRQAHRRGRWTFGGDVAPEVSIRISPM
jgi:hypothetical protein